MIFTENETTSTIGYCKATCLAKTINNRAQIVTWELLYPRYIHAELLTHRCLTADTVLAFDLPTGAKSSGYRIYTMTLGEFWDKWENGSAPHTSRWGSVRRYDMKGRLNKMRLRSVDESTMEVTHTTITDCWKVGIKPVYKLVAGEHAVTCTADHLLLTDTGWKELQDITVGVDKVLCNTRKKYVVPKFDPYKKINGQWVSKWTKQVLPEVTERQLFKCADCGCEGESLEIHHVVPKHVDPSLAFDIDNVVALCSKCHNSRHSTQGWQGASQCNVLPITVDSIEYVGEQEVFDISVSSDFHNFLANGITVHNCFSRNASSSRATPLSVTLQEVRENPVCFNHVGLNQSGMCADVELCPQRKEEFKKDWKALCNLVADKVEELSVRYGIHKQVLNRALEPFLPIRVIVTTTETENFFKLRLAKNAQPEIRDLARCMYESMSLKEASHNRYHLPYSEYFPESENNYQRLVRCVCACARVSVGKQNGRSTSFDEDEAFFWRLFGNGHLSPFEHCAKYVEGKKFENFYEYQSARNLMTFNKERGASIDEIEETLGKWK